MQYACQLVEIENKTIYAASKESGVPWSTLKHYLKKDDRTIRKCGRPFALTAELELKLLDYIKAMKKSGVNLTAQRIQSTAFAMAQTMNRQHLLSPRSGRASIKWWSLFKKRYNINLKVNKKLSSNFSVDHSVTCPTLIDTFYENFDSFLTNLDVKNCSSQLWNCDEIRLTYGIDNGKVFTSVGNRDIYDEAQRVFEREINATTMLGCACADGTWIPPMFIIKKESWSDKLKYDALPNSTVKVSANGWTDEKLFLEWFKFFISAISDIRPVVLLMGAHDSNITPEVIALANKNGINILTFPESLTHSVQPLHRVYEMLKVHWNDSVHRYVKKFAIRKSENDHFHKILNTAYTKAFTLKNIMNAFKHAGLCPLSKLYTHSRQSASD